MRSESEIYADLDAAQAHSRELRLNTEEYRENRQHIASLVRELMQVQSLRPAAFTPDDYRANPDSFEQSAINRRRRVA